MPHIVLDGPIDLLVYSRAFQPLLIRDAGDVLRAERVLLAADARSLLVEALAVEAGRKQAFYVKIAAHEGGGATVRIDPMTHVERSFGVRRLVAEVGADLLSRSPGARIAVTNLVVPSRGQQDSGGS